jgi:TnpA family transposase
MPPSETARRSVALPLPEDLGEEELARNWTLSEADRAQVLRCRGDDNRRRFAVQLCVLRHYGRFLKDFASVPVRILNHISRQLGLTPVLSLSQSDREATEVEYEQRLRDDLGYRSFDAAARANLEEHLRSQLAQGMLPEGLRQQAEDALRFWRIIPPSASTLNRLVASIAATGRQEIFDRIAARLNDSERQALDQLLPVGEEDHQSPLAQFREYPPEATGESILAYIEHHRLLRSPGLREINLSGIHPHLAYHLYQLARKYDAQALKRFAPATRYALLSCFVVETQRTLLDHLIQMHEQFLTTMCRKSRHAFEEKHRAFRRRARKGIQMLLGAVEILLQPGKVGANPVCDLYEKIGESCLREALADCYEFERLEEAGYQNELRARYSGLRRYLPAFLELPLQAEPGAESLLRGIELLREINRDSSRPWPQDIPISGIVPTSWQPLLKKEDGDIDRRLWEISLALAVRDALRGGGLYLPESRHHVSFSNLVYNEQLWERDRKGAYEQLSLFQEGDQVIASLEAELEKTVTQTEAGLSGNPFASVKDGRLKLKRKDALPISPGVARLRRVIESSLPRVRIEDLLRDVDRRCAFSRAFQPLSGYESRPENIDSTLLALLIAHGTNLGIAAMGQSAQGITVDMLQHANRWFVREETLKAANAILVNYHHELPLSAVRGGGLASSSDGQRFGLQQSSLLASFYPRYFGYYERAIAVYTHLSDQYSVFGTRVISCSPREALYVLDGLLENNTILRLREHYTDTHGFTEHIFALCYLLGFRFMPRLRDLADQQLYRIDRKASFGKLDVLFRGAADSELIVEQWDQLVRVAGSLKNRTAPANVIVQRLANSSPSDRLAKALTALGRVIKTIYILRYIHDEELRSRVQLQLNRGESRHDLVARCLFFANRGEFRTGDWEEIMNKASCLSLLSNAVLVWNTIQISRIVAHLRAGGGEVADSDLAHISPLAFGHIIPNGTYWFDRDLQISSQHK